MASTGQKYSIGGSQTSGWTFAGAIALPQGTLITGSAQASITAGTTRTQAGAQSLSQRINRIDTATAPAAGSALGDGVRLMSASAGAAVVVINNTAHPVQVYGNGSNTLNGVAGATGIMAPPGAVYLFTAASSSAWACAGAGLGAAGGYPSVSAVDGLAAKAGGGQSGATLCAAAINRFTTVATAGDSGLLPAAKPGMQITVVNGHASNALNLFPATGEQINQAGGNVALSLPAGKAVLLAAPAAGAWHALLGA